MHSGNTPLCGMSVLCHFGRCSQWSKKSDKRAPCQSGLYLLQEFSILPYWSVLWVPRTDILHVVLPRLIWAWIPCVQEHPRGSWSSCLGKRLGFVLLGFEGTGPARHGLGRAWNLAEQPQTQWNPKVSYQVSHLCKDSPHFWSHTISSEPRDYEKSLVEWADYHGFKVNYECHLRLGHVLQIPMRICNKISHLSFGWMRCWWERPELQYKH